MVKKNVAEDAVCGRKKRMREHGWRSENGGRGRGRGRGCRMSVIRRGGSGRMLRDRLTFSSLS